MIDITKLREKPEFFKKATADKQVDASVVDDAIRYDLARRELIQEVEELRAMRNTLGKDDREKGKEIKIKLKELEPQLREIEEKLTGALNQIPNPAESDVKVGKDDTENDVLRTWGDIRKFEFAPKDHLELGEALDIIDVKRAANVSGARFYYLKGDGARLEWALLQFAIERLSVEGFIPVIPPVMIKKESMAKMGYLEHGGEEDMYVLDKDGLVLVGTSEQSIGPMHMNEVFESEDLPRRYFGYSPCFRREAGSYGKDTKGILRVHEFNKVEMFSFTKPEDSKKEHEFLLSIEEKLFQALELPYQVIKMCTGDLGAPASKKYDLEAWVPTQEKYREVTSTSNTTNFQSRRLNIKCRYRESSLVGDVLPNSAPIGMGAEKIDYVHMLNGTAFSMGRPIIAIMENNQQEDGSIKIPKILQKYMGKSVISSK